ncbi:MAG: hypothetical protein HQM13_11500 [SAR324 cluster bacterium]|nr:hypothetical protein [SAR324 cluster bacterium]
MKSKIFLHKLTHNQFGEVTIGNLLVALNHLVPQSFELLKINVERYRRVSSVNGSIPKTRDPSVVYQILCDIFPTFPLVVAGQLGSQSKFSEMGQQFQLAGIGSLVAQYDSQHKRISHFIEKLDLGIDISDPASGNSSSKDFSYLPKLVRGDLILLSRSSHWQPSEDLHDRIETFYSIQGGTQLLLRYYFDLIVAAPSDQAAQYIDAIFLNFFINLRHQETNYWQSYSSGRKMRTRVKRTIEKNSQITGHPILKKTFFDDIDGLLPIAHDGSPRKMSLKINTLLNEQLEKFSSRTPHKIALILRTITVAKDARYARFLMLLAAKANPNCLSKLSSFLESSSEDESLQVLNSLIGEISPGSFATRKEAGEKPEAKKPRSGFKEQVIQEGDVLQAKEVDMNDASIFQTDDIKRRLQIEENKKRRAAIAAYTSDQLEGYLNNYLDNLYKKNLKPGRAPQGKSAKKMAQFAKTAASAIKNDSFSNEDQMVFEDSIDSVLSDLKLGFGDGEMEEYQAEIKETLADFSSVEGGDRVEKIEEVSNVLNAAAEMSELRQEADERDKLYKEALQIQFPVDDNPEHVITVEKFLEQPISLVEKMRYLHSLTPDPLPVKLHRIVQEVQNFCSNSSSSPVPIYKGGTLLVKALARLLFPHHPFKVLLTMKIVHIVPDPTQPPIAVRDFFTFPLAAKKKGPSEDAWFEQHFLYLEKLKNAGKMEEADYDALVDNAENFPILNYKKYHSIIRKNKFEDTTFMAVYSLWQNNGLERLRVEE